MILSPIDQLIQYHNYNYPHEKHNQPEIIIITCMDYRLTLNIPPNFAYVIRTAGANLRLSEFPLSYAIGVGKTSTVALIGHNQCGMSNLIFRRSDFIQGMVHQAGWSDGQAETYFDQFYDTFYIGDERNFLIQETIRLRSLYPKVKIFPLIYSVDDHLLSRVGIY